MQFFDTHLTGTQADEFAGDLIETTYQFARQSEYFGMVGSGDEQKIRKALDAIHMDFDFQHIYGLVYGLIVAFSLTSDFDGAAEAAMEWTDDLLKVRNY